MKRKVYEHIARELLKAEANRGKDDTKYDDMVDDLEGWVRKNGPSGSGIDTGTKLERSTSERIVLRCEFHHMNDAGYYTGWTSHTVIVKPSLCTGIEVSITGHDKNQIKEYLGDVYYQWLKEEIDV
jgi:hypothetical protein